MPKAFGKGELSGLFSAYSTFGKSNFNSELTGAGGIVIRDDIYWSSTEDDARWVWIVNFNTGSEDKDDKISRRWIRGIMAF
jgi:hypothetical protein